MNKVTFVSTFSFFALACGPEVDEDDTDEPPGVLEYEIPTARFYRLDRRVDIIGVDPMVDISGCGFLTDRAYDDLVGTLEAIDPTARYDWSDCEQSPLGVLHLEGFEYSPFACNWYCCNHDLLPIATVYFAAVSTLDGPDPNIDGEPYVALEPDVPCP